MWWVRKVLPKVAVCYHGMAVVGGEGRGLAVCCSGLPVGIRVVGGAVVCIENLAESSRVWDIGGGYLGFSGDASHLQARGE